MENNNRNALLVLLAFSVYLIKVPVAFIFFLDGNIKGVFFTLLISTTAEIAIFTYLNDKG